MNESRKKKRFKVTIRYYSSGKRSDNDMIRVKVTDRKTGLSAITTGELRNKDRMKKELKNRLINKG